MIDIFLIKSIYHCISKGKFRHWIRIIALIEDLSGDYSCRILVLVIKYTIPT